MTRAFILTFFCALAAAADEVVLKNGHIVEGKVEVVGDEVRITKGKSSVTYPSSMVREIRYRPTREEEFESRRRKLEEGDLAGLLDLARWCSENGLKEQSAEQYSRVLRIDPSHEEARTALGHRLHEGRWMTEEEYQSAQGKVLFRGQWVSPEDKALAEETERAAEAEKEILRQVRRALGDLAGSGESRHAEARAALRSIAWEFKINGFISACGSFSSRVRRYVAGELGDSGDRRAIAPLARLWLHDSDEETRNLAERSLARLDSGKELGPILIKGLFNDRRDVLHRCVLGLRDNRDAASVPYLIDLLQAEMERLGEVAGPTGERILGKRYALAANVEAVFPDRMIYRPTDAEFEAKRREIEQAQLEAAKMRLKTGQAPQGVEMTDPKAQQEAILKEMEKEAIGRSKIEIGETLRAITGESFGADLAQWREWRKKGTKSEPGRKE
jgi:hypothetical protein